MVLKRYFSKEDGSNKKRCSKSKPRKEPFHITQEAYNQRQIMTRAGNRVEKLEPQTFFLWVYKKASTEVGSSSKC